MNCCRPLFAIGLLILGLIVAIEPAHAIGNDCSVSGTTSVSIGNYNPFTGSTFNQVPVTLRLTRYVKGNDRTQEVNFYFVQPVGSPVGYGLRYNSNNVLYTLPATHSLSVTSPPSGTVFYDFGGNGQPNTVSIPLLVTIPPGADLSAGEPIAFDIVYICNGRGALHDVTVKTTLASAITIKINVLSALQASYAGPALDFGEIGNLTDIASFAHSVTGMVRVASTGPYTVTMESANGYRMTYPGGSLATAAQNIKYGARFLGQTRDSSTTTFNTVACKRSGTGGQNLPLTLTLREGGIAKTPAPDYRDTLTVTITPLATPYGGLSWNCPTL